VVALSNGNYVVTSWSWDDGEVSDAGAVTWGNGATGIAGRITPANSLVGTNTDDSVGDSGVPPNDDDPVYDYDPVSGVVALSNGDYVVASSEWDNGSVIDAGAVTFGLGSSGVAGSVTRSNSVIGTPPGLVDRPGVRLTSGGAIPVPTAQNRVLLMFTPSPDLITSNPARILDTRADGETVDGEQRGAGTVGAGEFIEVPVVGRGGVPASGVDAAIINLTAINPEGRGFATSYACGTRPLASSLNYAAGQVVANELIAKLSPTGTICIFTLDTAHFVIDAVGYTPTI
jgi:hypothetical protein